MALCPGTNGSRSAFCAQAAATPDRAWAALIGPFVVTIDSPFNIDTPQANRPGYHGLALTSPAPTPRMRPLVDCIHRPSPAVLILRDGVSHRKSVLADLRRGAIARSRSASRPCYSRARVSVTRTPPGFSPLKDAGYGHISAGTLLRFGHMALRPLLRTYRCGAGARESPPQPGPVTEVEPGILSGLVAQ
jgi:hypothetical protein